MLLTDMYIFHVIVEFYNVNYKGKKKIYTVTEH